MSTAVVDVTIATSPAAPPRASALRKWGPVVLVYIISITVALVLCGVLVVATGGSATEVVSAMLDGAILSPGAWGLTITTATPLLVVAVGTIVQGKAGMSNIGQEGQVLMGAAATAFVGTRMVGSGPVVITASILAGVVVAGLWTLVPAVLRFTRKVPEVISTLLMLFIAVQAVQYSLTKRWLLASHNNDSRINNGEPLKPNASSLNGRR